MEDKNNATVEQAQVKARKSKVKGLPPAGRVYKADAVALALSASSGDVQAARIALEADNRKGVENLVIVGDTAESVGEYVNGYKNQAPQEGSGGYTSFVTARDGFTNKNMIEAFGPQGVAKQIALLLDRAAKIMLDGGNDSTEMAAALKGLNAYQSVAIEEVRKATKQKAMDDAIDTLTKAFGDDMNAARAALDKAASTNGMSAVEPSDTAETVEQSYDDAVGDEVHEEIGELELSCLA